MVIKFNDYNIDSINYQGKPTSIPPILVGPSRKNPAIIRCLCGKERSIIDSMSLDDQYFCSIDCLTKYKEKIAKQ